MSSRPRRFVRPDSPSFRSTLTCAAALVRSSLLREQRLLPSPFPKPNPRNHKSSTASLSPEDSLSRCLETPAASPVWQSSNLGSHIFCRSALSGTPFAGSPYLTSHMVFMLKSSSFLVNRMLEQQALVHAAASTPNLDLQDRASWGLASPVPQSRGPRSAATTVLAKANSLCSVSEIKGRLGWGAVKPHTSSSQRSSTTDLCPTSSTNSGRCLNPKARDQKARDQKPRKALGPLISHHALRAASSFHYLHGGLADVAAFGHHAPLDGSLKSKSSLGPRVDLPGSANCIASDTEALPADDTSENSRSADAASDSSLRLVSGACALPHPDKAEKGGEDAFFISSACQAVGVADGVGGWADVGVDAGAYARELMSEAMKALEGEVQAKGKFADPLLILETAHSRTSSQGSSTACLILLSDQKLAAANLGDSGFMIIRSGRTIFKSPPQQHDFNFPYQIGSAGGDPPTNAEVYSLPVVPGDVIVLGTDGLFDNVFDGELASMVMHSLMAGRSPQNTAEHIAALARIRAADRVRFSPFARAAMEAGFRYYGGKMDDITVVVSYVTSGGKAK